ncbi:unnamed protein product, partial [Durusdinium trenchii]
ALELQRPCVVLLSPEEPDLQEQCVRARVAPNAESLKQSAQVLQEVLVAAQLAANQSYDVEPGDSSDEEGGSDEGIRLRVRLRREEDKWGIKWHQQMFKSSRRLVVDEIAEGSPIDRWNASQPQGLQVRYGDRLERINGIRVRGSPAEVAGQFRVELHKEEMRALFWRPGHAPEKSDVVKAPKVLVAASAGSGGYVAGAAVALAHLLLYSEVGLSSALKLVEIAQPWLQCLKDLAPAEVSKGQFQEQNQNPEQDGRLLLCWLKAHMRQCKKYWPSNKKTGKMVKQKRRETMNVLTGHLNGPTVVASAVSLCFTMLTCYRTRKEDSAR